MTGLHKRFRDFLASVRLAIALLSMIAIGALLGTVIPQQVETEAFSGRLHPALRTIFEALQLSDVYHSIWFVLLLLLLAVNLAACSLKRFPAAWHEIRGGLPPDRSGLFASLLPGRYRDSALPPEEAAERIETRLRKRRGKVTRKQTDQGFCLSGETGAFSRLGVYVVHLGILLLIAGGLAGAVWGLKGHVEIAEGGTADRLHLAGGKGQRPLDFQIRCDRFVVEHYESGMPKLFRSDLVFLRDGKIEMKGALLVNHPLDFGGLRFYQSSYGRLPGGRQTLSWTQGGKPAGRREIHPGDRFALPDGAVKVEVLRVEGDLMRMGPAAKISVTDGKRTLQFWVFERIRQIQAANPGILAQVPMMNPGLFSPWLFSLEQTGERYFTVLLAARDPGAPLVALGAGLVLAGLIVVFFFSHRRFWIRVESYDGGSRIAVAGQSNRDHAGLETEMQRLLAAGDATEERT